MPGLGPFDSRLEALAAACPLVLGQRNASAGREGSLSFEMRWRSATEYCAWLYYTPDNKYELSMLVESTEPVPPGKHHERRCKAPAFVDDPRYPPRSLRYIYFIHNHASAPTNLSEDDIRATIKAARIHGPYADTAEGRVPIGVIAFYSNSYPPSAKACDGFYEYVWGSNMVLQWTPDREGGWRKTKAGTVRWFNEVDFEFQPGGVL